MSQLPGEHEQLAAQIAGTLRNPVLFRERGHSAEQIMEMVASSHPHSDAISIVPIAPPLEGLCTRGDVQYSESLAEVSHFGLFPYSRGLESASTRGCSAKNRTCV